MQTDELARRRWLSLPDYVRKNIEENVFCVTCGGVTTIIDYQVDSSNFEIFLRGSCKHCNGNIARVVD